MAVFEIDNDYIKNLGEVGLPKLVYQIMYYEIAKLNLLNQGLHISLNTKTGDGGSDGEFNFFNKPVPTNHKFLPNANIVFQFKAAEIGAKSWFEKEVIYEGTGNLKPKLKEFINKGYSYMLITNKSDLPATNLDAKEKILKDVFVTAGYPNVTVKIIDLTKLSEWANSIPQIFFTLNPNTKYFELFKSYEYDIKINSDDIEYVNDDKRTSDIAQIRNEINTTLLNGASSFIRVEGFSGIGKTRFIYETLNDEKYKEFVLYIRMHNDKIYGDLLSYCKKRAEHNKELVIFVIDECPYEEHTQICRGLKEYSKTIVITIDQIMSRQDTVNCKEESKIILEGLSEGKTVKLIKEVNPVLGDDIAKKIAYYTEGYPRLAYFMAKSYDIETGDTNNFDEKSILLDRILDTITDDVDDITLLQAISIFKLFPYSDEMKEYKAIIFEHFGIDRAIASIRIKRLVQKGIIRDAGRFLYISPRPVSLHLFNQFLSIYDYEFIDELFVKLKNQGFLMNSFFEKLQSVEFDSSQHKELLHQILSQLTFKQISHELGAKIFYSLCLKDRVYSISLLKSIFQNKSKEDLLKFEYGRRYLIHSLEKLISFENTFIDSAKILFKLAIAETETWSNNSQGVFQSSFTWILSGTEVNIVRRLKFLRELYTNYIGNEDRLILLDTLSNTYPKHTYFGTHKNSSNIPENIPKGYRPNTQKEIDEYFSTLKNTIVFMYDNSSIELQFKIIHDLISSLRLLIIYKQIDIWVLNFIVNHFDKNTDLKSMFFEQISFVLKYDKGDISKETLKYLDVLNNKVLNIENIDDVKEIFYSTEQYRYNNEDMFNKHCEVLTKNLLETRDFDVLLNMKTSNTFFIGKELGLLDEKNILHNDILALITKLDKGSNIRFIASYIFNNKMGEESQHKNLFENIYNRLNDKSIMFEFIHSSNIKSQTVIEYLYLLLEKKEMESSLLENLTYGFWLRDFNINKFIAFIDKINSIIDNKCDSFGLCMQYIHLNKEKLLIEKYTNYYIENNIFNCHNPRINHDIENMIDEYFTLDLELSTNMLLKVWKSIVIELKGNGKFEISEFNSVYKILKKYSNFFCNTLLNNLDEVQPSRYPIYGNYLNFMQGGNSADSFSRSIFSYFNVPKVLEWLKVTKYENAKYIIADSLNIDFKTNNLPDIVIEILTEFPNDTDLYGNVTSKYEGWSGSYVPVANEKISNIESMIEKNNNNKSVVDFLKWAKKGFEARRNREQTRDEEENIY